MIRMTDVRARAKIQYEDNTDLFITMEKCSI